MEKKNIHTEWWNKESFPIQISTSNQRKLCWEKGMELKRHENEKMMIKTIMFIVFVQNWCASRIVLLLVGKILKKFQRTFCEKETNDIHGNLRRWLWKTKKITIFDIVEFLQRTITHPNCFYRIFKNWSKIRTLLKKIKEKSNK